MEGRGYFLTTIGLATLLLLAVAFVASAQMNERVYLPGLFGNGAGMQEVRALWVTRFDWTTPQGADPQKIDEIVANAATAGFNVLFFQVRAEADAYYRPGLEPWSRRLTGTLGQDPGWDPLGRLIERAHASGLQVHAYVNVYPLWTGCEPPPDNTNPRHLYYQLSEHYGTTADQLNAAQWDSSGKVDCSVYTRVTPASTAFEDHLLLLVADLVQRYDIDGLHLDHMRYAGQNTSCDPVSIGAFGSCSFDQNFGDWQRQQINTTVERLYELVTATDPSLWLTSTTWPVYRDEWGWGVSSGFDTYYQDAKAWLQGAYIDGIVPMIYTGTPDCSRPYFWTRQRWEVLVEDYQASSNGRFVIGGIGTAFCTTNDFAEIEARIGSARASGLAGHAIFSYRGLADKGYFDDLAAGPYASPATLPSLSWR